MTDRKTPPPPGQRKASAAIDRRIAAIEARLARTEAARIDELLTSVEARCRSYEKQLDRLMRRHALLMTKFITATECAWYARRFLPEIAIEVSVAAIWVFDLPDTWWEERAKATLGTMIRNITAEWREHRGREYDDISERLAGMYRDLGDVPPGWADDLEAA